MNIKEKDTSLSLSRFIAMPSTSSDEDRSCIGQFKTWKQNIKTNLSKSVITFSLRICPQWYLAPLDQTHDPNLDRVDPYDSLHAPPPCPHLQVDEEPVLTGGHREVTLGKTWCRPYPNNHKVSTLFWVKSYQSDLPLPHP